MQGRILTFSVKDTKLRLVSEKEVKGAVYNVNPFQVAALPSCWCSPAQRCATDACTDIDEPTLFHRRESGRLHSLSPDITTRAEVHVQGKLIAGVNSKVQLFKWIQTDDGSRELQIECSHTGHVLALYVVTRGDFVIVGEK